MNVNYDTIFSFPITNPIRELAYRPIPSTNPIPVHSKKLTDAILIGIRTTLIYALVSSAFGLYQLLRETSISLAPNAALCSPGSL